MLVAVRGLVAALAAHLAGTGAAPGRRGTTALLAIGLLALADVALPFVPDAGGMVSVFAKEGQPGT
jgi:hypothetical protein